MIAGVDGYRGKRWIAAIQLAAQQTRVELFQSFSALLDTEHLSLILIDVPIGLMEKGDRACDRESRALLRGRRSSVYPAPIRSMLPAVDYEDACRRRFAVENKRCSVQLFAILPIIRDVDAAITPGLQLRIREGHPEVSFTLMNDGSPMRHPKREEKGRTERLSLLKRHFSDIEEQMTKFGNSEAATDIVDAYALLWSARRIERGTAVSFPQHPQYDPRGLRAEIAG